jgi:hypothetical protein
LRDIAETLTAYLAIPALLLYPFGFLALFVQFARYFEFEFYTAWYAASLVNRVVAIGLGFSILVVTLVGSVLLSGLVSQILLRHDNGAHVRSLRRQGSLRFKLALVAIIMFALYILYSRMLAAGRVYGLVIFGNAPIDDCREEALRHQLNLWPDSLVPALILVAGGLWGGWLTYKSYRRYRHGVSANEGLGPVVDYRTRSIFQFLTNGVTQGWIVRGLVVAYTFGIVASLVLAWAMPGFMPFMTYGNDVQALMEKPLENRFLSYTDGRWYFIHRGENEEGQREYRVLSARDDEVKYVGVRRHPDWASRAAPFPWSENAVTRTTHLCVH